MASLAPAEKAPTGKPLKVGSPHDPAEREADRIADLLTAPEEPAMPVCAACAAGGAPCAACGGGAEGWLLRRQVDGGGDGGSGGEMVAPPSVHRVLSEPGEPLPAGIRGKFERRLGRDLSGVAFHAGRTATLASESLHARGFALGLDIVLGGSAPAPDTAAGERLLAHEVAHTLEPRANPVIRRQTPPVRSAPADPALAALTNADFLAEMVAARDPGAAPGLRAAVEAERRRRVALGHEWLSDDLDATPSYFYRLVPAGGVDTAVVRADSAQALGAPQDLGGAPIMTEAQFQRRLLERGIPTFAASMLGPVASGSFGAPLEMPTVRPGPRGTAPMPYVITDPASAPPGMRTIEVRVPIAKYFLPSEVRSGAAPSATYQPETIARVRSGTPTMQDLALLLSVQPYDIGQLRVLSSVTGGEPTALGFDTFHTQRSGFVDGYAESVAGTGGVGRAMLGERMVRALRLGQKRMVLSVSSNSRPVEGAAPGDPTAVERFHQEIQRAAGYDSGFPPTEGSDYLLDAQQMARLAVVFGGAANTQEAAVIQRIVAGEMGAIAELAALPRPDLEKLFYRARLESFERGGFADRFRARTASPLTPEWAAAAAHGPWAAGGRATVTGTGFGAVLGLGLDAAFTAGGNGNWDAFEARAPRTVTLGAVGGGVSMATEQALVSRSSAALMAEGAMPGLATGGRLLVMRTVAGGVGAGVVELVLIYGFEDRPHSATEVVGRTARSTGIGIVSAGVGTLATAGTTSLIGAILASGGTGAVGGSVVPGWGTAIGFIVGIGAGVLTYVVLDRALPRMEPTAP